MAVTATPNKRKNRAQGQSWAKTKSRLKRVLGPGLIAGASDDDPSGIGTYSQAGAQLGFAISWTMLFSYPLMVAIQRVSAQIGRTTGQGIAGNIRQHYPNWLLQSIVARWQSFPDIDVVTELADAGMTVPQARVVATAGDASATRTVVTALEYTLDGPRHAASAITIIDSLVGRVLVSNCTGPDGRQWAMVFPGTAQRIATAVRELLESLPSGAGWMSHQRIE